jgi:serine/threonine-protein kinase
MHPGKDRPPPEKLQLIKRWIDDGAPQFPPEDRRELQSLDKILLAIAGHLERVPSEDRPFRKYFSFASLYNRKTVKPQELRYAKAALSKLINSLSWKHEIVVPRGINAEGVIYTIDLRDLGWEKPGFWQAVQRGNPYALDCSNHIEQAVRDAWRRLRTLSGDQLCWVQADWFISTASRPPRYHLLLELPEQVDELERRLNVDVKSDFEYDRLARAGFNSSLVSRHNRVVDRHFARYGAYWRTYDFHESTQDRQNVFHFPLGPAFTGHRYPDLAFLHDGSEVLFHLPNGLQAYMLMDNKGRRIDVAPADVTRDALESAGDSSVVNGLSCLRCHASGLRPFRDELRQGADLKGAFRNKLELLTPQQATMDELVRKDLDRFSRSLELATGPFLRVDEDLNVAITRFAEPIGVIANRYHQTLNAADVEAELGLEPGLVADIVNGNPRLKAAGLGPLARQDGSIKREVWAGIIPNSNPPESRYQLMARELEQGTAVRPK